MQQICVKTGKPFTISDFEQKYCEEHDIPLPVVHPIERLRNMAIFRNRPYLYNTTCGYSKKQILSCLPPESGFRVYDVDIWQSDSWDALDYGRDFDFNRPFFEQFGELMREVPWPNLAVVKSTMENSDFCNGITGAKNSYLSFACSYIEDCLFCKNSWYSRNLIDCLIDHNSELCYECIDTNECYNLNFSEHCSSCSDSWFLYNCQSCSNCFGCANLYKKQYCFYNQQLTKEGYQKKMSELDFGSYSTLTAEKNKWAPVKDKLLIKNYHGQNNENSSGNFIYHTKNAKSCLMASNCEDMEYCVYADNAKSCLFMLNFGNNAELIYNCHCSGDNVYNHKFCSECFMNSSNLEYCIFCQHGCDNCFGCCSMTKHQYCLFNKQYSESEYFELRKKVIEHMKKIPLHQDYAGQACEWGQFFPASLSPFYYNQSEVSDYFPLTRDEALKQGFAWKDEVVEAFTPSYKIPDHIRDVGDDILQAVLRCEKTGKKYRIIKQELDYYRKNNLPIPRISPFERIQERCRILEFRELQEIVCQKCGKKIETMYDPKKWKIYCEECYQKEVF
ncbi:MAG: hypothetical protein NTZ80_01335 [Patescibacteria group bacterium]|nr:hypothetical protein [Patescibacteria group bacterium]